MPKLGLACQTVGQEVILRRGCRYLQNLSLRILRLDLRRCTSLWNEWAMPLGLGRVSEEPELGTAQDVQTLRLMLPFLWPRDDLGLRVRLVLSISLLLGTAGLNGMAPLLFALAVDRFVPVETLVLTLPLLLLLSYGAVHSLGKALSEWRWALYGPIEQRLKRNMGMTVFRHLHDLSLRFHISRRTGSLSRIMDNGTRGIDRLLMATVFLVLPLLT